MSDLKKPLFLAALSGILLIASFPKFGVGACAWIALVPLLIALPETGFSGGFGRGFMTGFLFSVGLLYWITFVVVKYGYFPLYLGIAAMLAVSLYLALYWGIFAGGVTVAAARGIPRFVAAPLLFTCLEYAKSHLLTGFPWENLAYSQYLASSLIQIADVTGTYGITFLIVLANAALADLFRPGQGMTRYRAAAEVAVVAGLVLGTHVYGVYRIGEVRSMMESGRMLPVTLTQGNIDQSIKWNPIYQRETIDAYKALSLQHRASDKPGLIVWPETAVPDYFQDQGTIHEEVTDIARRTGSFLLFGSPAHRKEGADLQFYNSAFLLSSAGEILGRYDKVHLVPYGEYVPLRRFFPFVSKIVVGVGDFGAGKGYLPLVMNDRKVGIMICYEAIFPASGVTYKRHGADLLVNITNDAWFGTTSAPHQHLSMTVFRAIETRLFLLRAANTGITAIIDPAGRIVARTPLFVRTALHGQVTFITMNSFYSSHGDIFAYCCLAALALIILWKFRRRTHHA